MAEESKVTEPGAEPAAVEPVVVELNAEIKTLRGLRDLLFQAGVGAAVFTKIYRGDLSLFEARGRKDSSIEQLARMPDVKMSSTSLRRAVRYHLLAVQLGGLDGYRRLTVGHLRAVLELPFEEQKRLLDQAESENWEVGRLEREIDQGAAAKSAAVVPNADAEALREIHRVLRELTRAADEKEGLVGDLTNAHVGDDFTAPLLQALETVRVQVQELHDRLTPEVERQKLARKLSGRGSPSPT